MYARRIDPSVHSLAIWHCTAHCVAVLSPCEVPAGAPPHFKWLSLTRAATPNPKLPLSKSAALVLFPFLHSLFPILEPDLCLSSLEVGILLFNFYAYSSLSNHSNDSQIHISKIHFCADSPNLCF